MVWVLIGIGTRSKDRDRVSDLGVRKSVYTQIQGDSSRLMLVDWRQVHSRFMILSLFVVAIQVWVKYLSFGKSYDSVIRDTPNPCAASQDAMSQRLHTVLICILTGIVLDCAGYDGTLIIYSTI